MFDYKQTISISLLGIAICSPVLAVHIVANVSRGIDDAYAQWGAVDMVTDYMDEHEGEWPRDWASLEPYFARGNGRVGGWSFAHFQSRVWIDFSADAAELRAASLASEKTRTGHGAIGRTLHKISASEAPNPHFS